MGLIQKDNYVKWQVSGGFGYGKVIEASAEKANIELPTGSHVEKETKGLVVIEENAYEEALSELVKTLSLKSKNTSAKAEKEKTMAVEIEKVQAELTKSQDTVKTLQAEIDALKAEAAKSKKDMEDKEAVCKKAKSDAEAAQTELATIRKAQKAESRFSELKGLNAVAAVNADEVKAKSEIAEMSDEVYAATLKMAKAFPKTTDQTQTGLPKATDQTESDKKKATEAEEKAKADKESADAVAKAKTEKDANLAAAATAKAPNTLQAAMAKLMGRAEKETK